MLLDRCLGQSLLEPFPQLASGLLAQGGETWQGRVWCTRMSNEIRAALRMTDKPFCISSTRATSQPINTETKRQVRCTHTDDPIAMFSCSFESFLEQPLELHVGLRANTTEYLDILQWELEWSRLEPDVSRRIGEHKAKVDVDEMAGPVNEYIPVVPVLDLQQVCHDGVALVIVKIIRTKTDRETRTCQRLCEIALCTRKLCGFGVAISLSQVDQDNIKLKPRKRTLLK